MSSCLWTYRAEMATSGAGNGVDVGVFREPQNGFDRNNEYGLAEFDVKQRFVASAVWQLPFGEGRPFGSDLGLGFDWVFGGWEFSPILTIQEGIGLSITQSEAFSIGGERKSRPNRIGS